MLTYADVCRLTVMGAHFATTELSSSLRLGHRSAYVSIRQHTSAYVSIRQHTSAYVSIRQHTSARCAWGTGAHFTCFPSTKSTCCTSTKEALRVPELSIRQHTSAYVYVCILQHTSSPGAQQLAAAPGAQVPGTGASCAPCPAPAPALPLRAS
jgi:hypothetical protein